MHSRNSFFEAYAHDVINHRSVFAFLESVAFHFKSKTNSIVVLIARYTKNIKYVIIYVFIYFTASMFFVVTFDRSVDRRRLNNAVRVGLPRPRQESRNDPAAVLRFIIRTHTLYIMRRY